MLRPVHAGPVPRGGERAVWPSIFLLFCLALLVIARTRFFPKISKIVQSTFSFRTLQQLEREELSPFRMYSLLLNLFFILNLSFLLYKVNSIYNYALTSLPDLAQFVSIVGIISVVSVIKAAINRLIGEFSNERKVISEYVVNALFINQTFGLLLFPFLVLMQLSTLDPRIFISAGLVVLGASLLLKWYRGVMIGLVEERIGLLQIFSYFCSLEILPVFVLVKYLVETF